MEDQVKRNEENLSPLVLARACEQLFYNMVGTNEEDTIQEKQKWMSDGNGILL